MKCTSVPPFYKNTKTKNIMLSLLYLPTFRILPVQVQTVKVIFFNEIYNVINETFSSTRIVDKAGIFVTSGIIPTANGYQYLNSFGLVSSYFFVEF